MKNSYFLLLETFEHKKTPELIGRFKILGGRPDSNRRPLVPQTNALTN